MTGTDVVRATPPRKGHTVSLSPLVHVAEALKRARSGGFLSAQEQKALVQTLAESGSLALPVLLRALESDSDEEANLAQALLCSVDVSLLLPRVRRLLKSTQPTDRTKERALWLLANLGLSAPSDLRLRDPEQFVARSVAELLSTLDTEEDFGLTARELLTTLSQDELMAILRGIVRHGGKKGVEFLNWVLRDAQTPQTVVAELSVWIRPPSVPAAEPAELDFSRTFSPALMALRVEADRPVPRALQTNPWPAGILQKRTRRASDRKSKEFSRAVEHVLRAVDNPPAPRRKKQKIVDPDRQPASFGHLSLSIDRKQHDRNA
ncbi:MAG TPA: hypothetical protein PKE31_13405 [Pseudomonadota bacterium]|nr:hypothetical protein [Pseudomonadota bacterium]